MYVCLYREVAFILKVAVDEETHHYVQYIQFDIAARITRAIIHSLGEE